MNAKIKKVVAVLAATIASACMALSIGAYTAINNSVDFSATTSQPTWNNKNTTTAWYLPNDSKCKFTVERKYGNGVGTFRLMQWTIFDEQIGIWTDASYVSVNFSGRTLPSDDYYATAQLTGGSSMSGKMTLSYN